MRPLLPLTCLATLVWLPASPGAAQDYTAEVLAIRGDAVVPDGERQGVDLRRGPGTPAQITINAAECSTDTEIQVQVRNFPGTGGGGSATTIDVWRASEGVDCSTEAERNPLDGNCQHVTGVQNTQPQNDNVLFDAAQLVDCDDTTANGSNASVWLLATTSVMEPGPVIGAASITLQLDQVPPGPPENVSAGTGDTQIRVDWDAPSGTSIDNLFQYRVYGDSLAADCADPNGEIVPGQPPPADAGSDATANNNATSTTVSGADIGLEEGEETRIALTAVDRARNESVLSETACLVRVPTEGFCAAHEAAGGTCDGCGVGGDPARGVGLAGLVLVGLALLRRRNRS